VTEEHGAREAEILAGRRASLERLRAAGIEPFALSFDRSDLAADLHAAHADLPAGEDADHHVRIAGRVVLARRHGKLTFLVVRDRSGEIQLFCDEASLGETYGLLDEVDLGDIVGAAGRITRTKRGELSVKAESITMLTKALRPLPEKWHGLKDPDLQQRQRYLHLIADETPRRYFLARAAVLKTMRRVLDERGFVEFEGPTLQTVAGGANARPFTTHHQALDVPMKLRISLELHLKRMEVGGIERVYELGRIFRNEGIDRDHNPEFTMLEAYQAYGDYETMMELTEALVVECARAVNPIMGRPEGSLSIEMAGRPIDLTPPFDRLTMLEAVSAATGERITLESLDLHEVAGSHGVQVDPAWTTGMVVKELFEKLVEATIDRPTFVCDFPREVSPLARPHRSDPGLTEHFDLVAGGLELVTAFSELTDPDEQRSKFELQQQMREVLGDEAHPLDEDFLRALEHGMPPMGGLGMGVDRLLLLLTGAQSLRDLIMFPQHRPQAAT
jgi:lysyl-tRNA synthetase class 2